MNGRPCGASVGPGRTGKEMRLWLGGLDRMWWWWQAGTVVEIFGVIFLSLPVYMQMPSPG